MAITLDQFVTKHLGKKIDFDGAYAGQCVDLFRQYVQEVLEYPQPKGVGGAKDFWANYDTDLTLKNYYEKIPNSPTGVPQKGDVLLWDKDAGGGFGHVAVFLEGDVNGFTSFDQNWPTLSVCTKTRHNYDNVYGWLRPKKTAPGLPTTIPVETTVFEKIRSNSEKWDATVKYVEITDDPAITPFERVRDVIKGIRSRVTDLTNQLSQATSEVTNREEQVSRLKDQLLNEQNLHKDVLIKLKAATGSVTELTGVYEGRITALQTQIDTLAKEKGAEVNAHAQTKGELEALKTRYAELLNQQTADLSFTQVIGLLFRRFRK